MPTTISTSDDLPVTGPQGVYQGQTKPLLWTWSVTGTPVDLTGWTGQFRVQVGADVVLDLPMTLGGTAGTVAVTLTSTQTAALPKGGGRYEVALTDGAGAVTVLVVGPFAVTARVGG